MKLLLTLSTYVAAIASAWMTARAFLEGDPSEVMAWAMLTTVQGWWLMEDTKERGK